MFVVLFVTSLGFNNFEKLLEFFDQAYFKEAKEAKDPNDSKESKDKKSKESETSLPSNVVQSAFLKAGHYCYVPMGKAVVLATPAPTGQAILVPIFNEELWSGTDVDTKAFLKKSSEEFLISMKDFSPLVINSLTHLVALSFAAFDSPYVCLTEHTLLITFAIGCDSCFGA